MHIFRADNSSLRYTYLADEKYMNTLTSTTTHPKRLEKQEPASSTYSSNAPEHKKPHTDALVLRIDEHDL